MILPPTLVVEVIESVLYVFAYGRVLVHEFNCIKADRAWVPPSIAKGIPGERIALWHVGGLPTLGHIFTSHFSSNLVEPVWCVCLVTLTEPS